MRGILLLCFFFLLALGSQASAQDVVSASSGLLQYFEGAVTVDGKAIEHRAAVFSSLKNGSTLVTQKGRAELLLTPGVYLRVDENSSVRMLSNSLADTRVQLTAGTIILDSPNANSDNTAVLIYAGSEVRFSKPGVYRIDSDVSELQAYSGEAQVKHHGAFTSLDAAHRYYFALELTTDKSGDGNTDEFYDWAHNRNSVIADQNQLASADQGDAPDVDPGAGLFAVPPFYSSPGSSPNYAAPIYGSSVYAGGNDPFYLYPPTPNLGFGSYNSLIFLAPLRHRPVGSAWPGSTVSVYRPRPTVTRWPTANRYPTTIYLPRPTATGTTHVAAPPVIPHAVVPRVGAIGHR